MTRSPTDVSFARFWSLAPVKAQILVVDDEAALATAMARLVVSLGHVAVTARSAEAADNRLGADRFDLMLLDIDMPGMSGLEFLPWALKRDPGMPVIMLTGVRDAEIARACLEAGARNYLVKPPELPFLKLAVTDALAVGALLSQRNRMARLEG